MPKKRTPPRNKVQEAHFRELMPVPDVDVCAYCGDPCDYGVFECDNCFEQNNKEPKHD